MTWLRQGRYFYRSRREGQRVVSEYVGCGDVGALVAEVDNAKQLARAAARRALLEEVSQARLVDAAMADLRNAADEAANKALLAAGFHRHKRTWRRRRQTREC